MEFRQFTLETYRATLEKWTHEAEQHECFPDEVMRKLKWIEESFSLENGRNPNRQIAYGVFQNGESIAICVCDLVLSDRGQLVGRWLKLLNVTLSPEIDVLMQCEDLGAVQTAVQAYKAATLGAFEARLEHDADTLKLYGRNDELLKFQMTLLAVLQESEKLTIKASKEGRWLVLKH